MLRCLGFVSPSPAVPSHLPLKQQGCHLPLYALQC